MQPTKTPDHYVAIISTAGYNLEQVLVPLTHKHS
jgi:hypothetical protein